MLEWILEIWVGSCGADISGSGPIPVAGSCEHSNEPSGSIEDGGLLNLLSDYHLLM
jgi:hypothetical protein